MAKKKIIEGVKLVYSERLKLSINGNPQAKCIWEDKEGNRIEGKTAKDSSAGYCYDNYRKKLATIEYHTTPQGNIIFDYRSFRM